MDQLRIGSLARPLEPLAPEDTLARATEVIRSVPFDRVPVAVEGRLVGVVTAATLGSAAQTVLQDGISPEEIRLLSIDESVLSTSPALPADASLEEALSLLRHHGGSLPVIRADGLYLGMVDQADVAGALLQKARPPSIGGMATPLGVYLTTGVFSAGARGSLGLALTGAAIGSATVVVSVLMGLLIYGLERTTHFPIRASLNSVPAQWLDLNPYDIWGHILPIIALALFALLFRLLPCRRAPGCPRHRAGLPAHPGERGAHAPSPSPVWYALLRRGRAPGSVWEWASHIGVVDTVYRRRGGDCALVAGTGR